MTKNSHSFVTEPESSGPNAEILYPGAPEGLEGREGESAASAEDDRHDGGRNSRPRSKNAGFSR